jgi:transposase InsO family protein
MTTESPDWGYGRIHGELLALGFDVSWQTVRRIMLDLGLLPDPDKPYKTTWNQFIKSHFQSIAACDFFAVETLSLKGLTRWLVFFVIDISTRRVHIAGIHHDPAEPQMLQMARNLTDFEDGFLKGKRVLIHDRDPLFTQKFRETLKAAGVRSLKIPKRSPNLNSYSERFVWSAKHECFNKMILLGERHVRYVVQSYVDHYNEDRPHKGLDYRRPAGADQPPPDQPPDDSQVRCRQRLGGLLKSYYREAA